MNERDRILVRDMVGAGRDALSFVRGRQKDDIRDDRMLAFALMKAIEIIGEAASKVSPELKRSLPSIPWTDIVGMRNRLIHAYSDVDYDILWDAVTLEVDPLIRDLEKLVK
jgi:uncharacterized protein with HEPN domain